MILSQEQSIDIDELVLAGPRSFHLEEQTPSFPELVACRLPVVKYLDQISVTNYVI